MTILAKNFSLGAQRLIDHLIEHKIPFGISTGSSNEAFDQKATNLKDFFAQFSFIVKCGSDPEVKNGKPAPDAFDVARKRFNPIPASEKCLAFEDAPNGVESALGKGPPSFLFPIFRFICEPR